jgi:NACalpha-BTF3-like transcription factor
MANEYSTLIDPVRSPDNIIHQGYTSEALERALRGEVEFGPPNMRDYGESNVWDILNLLETAANPGPWDTLKANLTVPGTETRIFPTAENQLNMARMSLAMPGTPEYGKATIEQQSAKQLLPVLEGMSNRSTPDNPMGLPWQEQVPEPEDGIWDSIRDFLVQPAGAQADTPLYSDPIAGLPYDDPIAGLPNVDITPGYANFSNRIGWQGALRGLEEDLIKGRPDISGNLAMPSGARATGLYAEPRRELPDWVPEPIKNFFKPDLRPTNIEEYREGDPTWIRNYNPFWTPDWDDSDLVYPQSSGVKIPELGQLLASTEYIPSFTERMETGPQILSTGSSYEAPMDTDIITDINLSDTLAEAMGRMLENRAQYGLADISDVERRRGAETLFEEAERAPEIRQRLIERGPSSIREALESRNISFLPFRRASIAIPEGLPANKPFPESVTKLPEAVKLISAPPPQIRKPEPQPEARREPEKPQAVKPKPVKPKPAKTQSQTTAARRKRTSTKAKVNKVAKETKVPKSAASEALSRARGDANKAIMIAPVIHHFTEKKKKDPTVYVPSIRVGPTGQWIGGL